MAENKESFILYKDIIHMVRKLPMETQAALFMHILSYVNDENPVSDDILLTTAFEPIRQQLKRDLKKWQAIKGKRSDAGKVSAEKKKQQNQHVLTHVNKQQQTPTKSTVPVLVNVNDTVINKDIYEPFLFSLNRILGRKFETVIPKAQKQIDDLLKSGYTLEDFERAVTNGSKDEHHVKSFYKYLTLEFCTRPDKFEYLLNLDIAAKGNTIKPEKEYFKGHEWQK